MHVWACSYIHRRETYESSILREALLVLVRENWLPTQGQIRSQRLLHQRYFRCISTFSSAVSSVSRSLHMMQTTPPGNIERRKERVKPVSALAASPLAAMKDYPEDAEIRLRLQVLTGERS
jgi:hypothetical protein